MKAVALPGSSASTLGRYIQGKQLHEAHDADSTEACKASFKLDNCRDIGYAQAQQSRAVPPLEPPWMMRLLGEVCLVETRCSPQAAKSSNTFCFWCREPALRQSMPYSPPPLHQGH